MAQYDPQRSRSRPRKADDEGPAPVDALLGDAPDLVTGSPVTRKAPAPKSSAKKSVTKKAPAQKSAAKQASAKKPVPVKKPVAENARPVDEVPIAQVAGHQASAIVSVQPSVAEPGPAWDAPRPTPAARSSRRVPVAVIVAVVLALTGLVWWRRRARLE
jgi:cobalamin biosynthesis Mg chelatase CobN